MKNYFPSVIGQDDLKSRLGFYIDSYKQTGVLPNCLFVSAKGMGKSFISTELSKVLDKPMLLINSASIKSATAFIEQIVIPHVQDNKISLFLDEVHECANSKGLMTFLLSAMNITKEGVNRVNYQDYVLEFDSRKVTFLAATTEFHKLGYAFRDRCIEFHFKPYKVDELGKIIQKNCPTVKFDNRVLNEIVSVCRGAPRQCVRFASDILRYCTINKTENFTMDDWHNFITRMGVKPMGLQDTEWTYLKLLRERGKMTLTALAASLELSPTTTRTGVENFLLKQHLIKIEQSGRIITKNGMDVLNSVKN